jgi:GH25 family lysozyme M1 (1,4-beta-N-acetylmuramidase)
VARFAVPCLTAAAALVLAVTPAAASAPRPAAGPAVPGYHPSTQFHPEQDYLGSSIPDGFADSPDGPDPTNLATASPHGVDVSHYQGTINWNGVAGSGIRFAYIKATEGTGYTDPSFDRNYIHSYNQGIIRGAYHFARPNISSGATQARYFVNNGGGWSADGKTLPPMLDMETNPYSGGACYGLSHAQLRNWISDFVNTVKRLTGKYPTIYANNNWWDPCTGHWGGGATHDPLMIPSYGSSVGPLPAGWTFWTIWQYTSTGRVSGIGGNVDRDVFNGPYTGLRRLATCTAANPHCL